MLFRRKSDQGSAYPIWFIKLEEEEKLFLSSSSAGRYQGLKGITSKGDKNRERKARQHWIWQEVAYSSPTYILIRVLMDRYEYIPDPEDEPQIDDSTWWANPLKATASWLVVSVVCIYTRSDCFEMKLHRKNSLISPWQEVIGAYVFWGLKAQDAAFNEWPSFSAPCLYSPRFSWLWWSLISIQHCSAWECWMFTSKWLARVITAQSFSAYQSELQFLFFCCPLER